MTQDKGVGAAELMKLMTENRMFRGFALPDVDNSKPGYDEWAQDPLVLRIKRAVQLLGARPRPPWRHVFSCTAPHANPAAVGPP